MNADSRRWWLIPCCAVILGCTPKPAEPVKEVPKSSAVSPADVPIIPVAITPERPAPPTVAGTVLRFRDATKEMGLDFIRFDDMQGENRNQEANGGGVAVADFDLDGYLDLYFPQGCRLPLRTMTDEFSNEFFLNRGGKQFTRVTNNAGLTAHGFYTGCTVGDVDEDGFPDLYVTAFGRSAVYRNNGDGTFANVTEASGASFTSWSTSAAFADFNKDGLLDLFVATYVKASDDPPMICKEPRSPTGTMQCSPTLFAALDDVLFVNNGQGEFIDVTRQAGVTSLDGKGLGALACDLTGDGWMDLHVANDTTPSFLYINETAVNETAGNETAGNATGGGNGELIEGTGIVLPRLRDRGTEFGVATNGEGRITAAMGIAHGDYDRDGRTDLFITNYYLEANTLFRNLEGKGFADMSTTSRLGPPSRSTLAFGTEFIDVDHDGWLDLLITTGHIEDRDWTQVEKHRMHPHLFRNERNGRFTDVASTAGPYFTAAWVGRGLALGDLDRDGDLDAVMALQLDPSAIPLNETPSPQTSVVIKPVGRGRSPRSAIGTRVVATGVTPVLVRDVAGGGSFQSASALELHFGLGDLKQFDRLECTWPDGELEHWQSVSPGYYIAVQGRGLVRIGESISPPM
jgi:hypothetical protein